MKKIIKVVIASLVLGLGLLILSLALGIDEEVFLHYYWRIGLGLIVLVALVNTCYYFYKVKGLKPIMALYEDMKYPEFVEEMEKLIPGIKNKGLKNIMKLNLGAGYLETDQADKLVDLYGSMDPKDLRTRDLKFIYWLNLAIGYFKLEDREVFDQLLADHKDLFAAYQDNKEYGESLDEVYLMKEIFQGNLEGARQRLIRLREESQKAKTIKAYDQLEKIIEDRALANKED